MFMQDFTKLTTAFAHVTPRQPSVVPAPVIGGIVAGTLVETETGWLPVENLRIGTRVHTLDGGLTRVLALDRRSLAPQAETSLIHVPGGHFDACSDLMLVPGQHVLLDTLGDSTHGHAPYLLVPAREWRLLAGMEAANGLLNFGLLTALLIEALRQIRLGQFDARRKREG